MARKERSAATQAKRLVVRHYASVVDLVALATSELNVSGNVSKRERLLRTPPVPFRSMLSAEECITMQKDGNEATELMVRTFHDKMAHKVPRALGYLRTKRRGDNGDSLDIHAVNRGNVGRAWTKTTREIKRGTGILRLVVDLCATGSTDASSMAWRGIAAASLTETMTKAGYSVELVGAFAVENITDKRDKDLLATVVIKPRSSMVDMGMLATTVCHAGFFRTLGFLAVIAAADSVEREVSSGFGHYVDVLAVLPVPDKVTQITVPSSIHTEQSAIDWVKTTVQLLQAGG